MPEPFVIRTVTWASSRDDLLKVRHEVFVVEQGVPAEIETDEDDPTALHFLACAPDGAPLGTGRLLPCGRIGRMAVRASWRRCGLGRALLEAVIETARHRGDARLYLHAQVHSMPFYESLGFTACGDEFVEAGIPHREMERFIS